MAADQRDAMSRSTTTTSPSEHSTITTAMGTARRASWANEHYWACWNLWLFLRGASDRPQPCTESRAKPCALTIVRSERSERSSLVA